MGQQVTDEEDEEDEDSYEHERHQGGAPGAAEENTAPVNARAMAVALMDRRERDRRLFLAIYAGDLEMIEQLLASGCSPMVKNKAGHTALQVSSAERNEVIIRLLIDWME